MQTFIRWLDGKKMIIGQIISLINVYLASQGLYSTELAALIQGILLALGWTAQKATDNMLGQRYRVK